MSFLDFVVRSLGDTIETLDRAIAVCDEPEPPAVAAEPTPGENDPGVRR